MNTEVELIKNKVGLLKLAEKADGLNHPEPIYINHL